MIRDMKEYCNDLERNHIVVTYCGPLWAGVIEELASMLKKRLAFDDQPLSVSLAVFSVFIEQMNNMLMYSAETEQFLKADGSFVETPKGTSILGNVGKTYFIQTGNVIKNESVEMVRKRIDHLNTLNKDELRKFYKEHVKIEDTNPESKGAGLGLIEVARRSDTPIEYSFVPYDEKRSFFTMYVTIGGGKHNGI